MDRRDLYKAKTNNKYCKWNLRSRKNKERDEARNDIFFENRMPHEIIVNEEDTNRTKKAANTQLTRQQLYYEKFLAWKKEKQNKKNNIIITKSKPFVPTVPIGRWIQNKSEAFNFIMPQKAQPELKLNTKKDQKITSYKSVGVSSVEPIAGSSKRKVEKPIATTSKQVVEKVPLIKVEPIAGSSKRNVEKPMATTSKRIVEKVPLIKVELIAGPPKRNVEKPIATTSKRIVEKISSTKVEPNATSSVRNVEKPIAVKSKRINEKVSLKPPKKQAATAEKCIRVTRSTASSSKQITKPSTDQIICNKNKNGILHDKIKKEEVLNEAVTVNTETDVKDISDKNPILNLAIPSTSVKDSPIINFESPKPNQNQSITYISSFVTTSRGKTNSNKKLKQTILNKSPGNSERFELRKNHEAAKYFTKQLQDETDRLKCLISEWNAYKREVLTKIDSENIDMIDVAIGQTNLLLTKKFQQFMDLIEQCKQGTEPQKVLPEDLEGFWHLIYIQVENCTSRFTNLEKLKANNWIDPELTRMKPPKVIKPISRKRKIQLSTAKPSDDLLKLITDTINKRNRNNDSTISMHPLFTSTPRFTEIINEPKKRSSPRLSNRNSFKTPPSNKRIAKSILKTPGSNCSDKVHGKSVVFIDEEKNQNVKECEPLKAIVALDKFRGKNLLKFKENLSPNIDEKFVNKNVNMATIKIDKSADSLTETPAFTRQKSKRILKFQNN